MRVLKSFDVEVKRGALFDVCVGAWGAYLVGVENGRGVVIFINEEGEEERAYLEGKFLNDKGVYIDAVHKCLTPPPKASGRYRPRLYLFTTKRAYLYTYRLSEVSSVGVDVWQDVPSEVDIPPAFSEEIDLLAVFYRGDVFADNFYFISPSGISLYSVYDTKFVRRAWRRLDADMCLHRNFLKEWSDFRLLLDEEGDHYMAFSYECVLDHVHDYEFASDLDVYEYERACMEPCDEEESGGSECWEDVCEPDYVVEVIRHDVPVRGGFVVDGSLNIVGEVDDHWSGELPAELERRLGRRIVHDYVVDFKDAHKVVCGAGGCTMPDWELAERLPEPYVSVGRWHKGVAYVLTMVENPQYQALKRELEEWYTGANLKLDPKTRELAFLMGVFRPVNTYFDVVKYAFRDGKLKGFDATYRLYKVEI